MENSKIKTQSSEQQTKSPKAKILTLAVENQNKELRRKNQLKYRAYYFSINIIKFVNQLSYQIVNKIVVDQLVRCATSIGANIIEAKASSSRKDFIRFYEIALKSANETKYWLCLVKDGLGLKEKEIDNLLNEVKEISKMLGSSILTLKNKKF